MTSAGLTVSVVVPTHCRYHALIGLVPRLLSDQALDELVVVVDGSSDESENFLYGVAATDARLRPIFQANRGRTLARQRGADEVTGDVVIFLDDDVLPSVPFVAGHARHHAETSDLVVVGAMTTTSDTWGPRVRLYDRAYRSHVTAWLQRPEALLEHFWGGHFSVRGDTLRRLDGFRAEAGLGYHEDYAFGLRCAAVGLQGRYDGTIAAKHHYERSAAGWLNDAAAQARDRLQTEGRAAALGLAPHGLLGRNIGRAASALPSRARQPLFVATLRLCDAADGLVPKALTEWITSSVAALERCAVIGQDELVVPPQISADDVVVGVVVPAYNAARFLSDTLASLVEQDHARWICVVVDDGSSDGTAGIAADWKVRDGRINVVTQPNRGVAAARNAGERALPETCTTLLFLDADDLLKPRMINTLASELVLHPEASMVHCAWRCIDQRGEATTDARGSLLPRFGPGFGLSVRLGDQQRETPFAGILCGSGIAPSMAMIRRSSFHAAGGWREDIGQPCEDTDLFLELALCGRVRWVPERLVSYRLHPEQNTANRDRLAKQWAALFARWSAVDHRPSEQRQAVLDAWSWRTRRFLPYMALRNAPRKLAQGHGLTAARHVVGAMRRIAALGRDTRLDSAGRASTSSSWDKP